MPGSLVISPEGMVVGYDAAEARRARVSRWQAIGRNFYRDLAWTLGPEVVERIRRFQDQRADADRFTAAVIGRIGRQQLEVVLARVDRNIHVPIVPS